MNQDIAIQNTFSELINQIADQIADKACDKVLERLRPYLQVNNRREYNTVMGVKEVAEYLGVKDAWVREQARSGNIPSFKTGDKWKFRTSEIDKHFSSRSLPSHISSSAAHKHK